ncbi:DUF4062 domain-containing protein [Microbacterium paraoxydans]|uniref:DUF4062 domain-containing protein n=1 Tax=Microbacterium paraoxydans TaxID=199592 RepID=UPI0021A6947F|nr:DUF4062 domain-containing protein [Microbacterium paraoxydans]MCT2225309.1 DUF4062 domain-containing protein [Microbacterium paraoxydans]
MTLFIASPGGVDAERDIVEAAAGNLNTSLGEIHRVMVSARRYEQLVGAAGNPQSQINVHADDADIFIGILHRRWGSPTGNGHDSGFFEEFSRALSRWKQNGRPRIALFFKEVDADSIKDPGAQLSKVIEFQKLIEQEHTAFYNRFSTTAELETLVTRLLAEELARLSSAPEPSAGAGATAESDSTTPPPKPAAGEPLSVELAGVFEAFGDVLAGRETEASLDFDRLEFFAVAISRDHDDVPVHLVNRLFRRRDELSLIGAELRAWLRRYIQDQGSATAPADRVIPFAAVVDKGWISDRLEEESESFLKSDDSRVRLGALRLLSALRLRPENIWPRVTEGRDGNLGDVWNAAAGSTTKAEMVRYWIAVHRRGDLSRARYLANQDGDLGVVGRALVGLFASNRDASLLLEVDKTLLVDPMVRELFGGVSPESTLADEVLVGLVSQSYLGVEIRAAAIREILARDALPAKALRKLVVSSDDTTWAQTLREVESIDAGAQIVGDTVGLLGELVEGNDDTDGRRRAGELLAVIARSNDSVSSAVEAAINRAPQFDEDAVRWRFVLHAGDPAERTFAHSLVRGENEHFVAYLDGLRSAGWAPRTIKFVQERIETHALEYLLGLDDAAHDEVLGHGVRRIAYDDESLSQRNAKKLLASIPSDSDVEPLLAESWWLRSARELIPNLMRAATLKRLRRLAVLAEEDVAVAAIEELRRRDRKLSDAVLKKLLRSPLPQVRLHAFSQLIDGADDSQITDVLSEYVNGKGTHYYNVISEADRRLSYMPI